MLIKACYECTFHEMKGVRNVTHVYYFLFYLDAMGEQGKKCINDIMKENPQIKLKVIETNDPVHMNKPILAHSRVGKDTYPPQPKIDAFASFMKNGI